MDAENRWLRYGLESNPYFPDPLNSTRRGTRPITLFHGRQAQVKDLLDTVASEESSLNLVEAPSGVGKSTFMNYVKHQLRAQRTEADPPKYFAPPSEIGVQTGETCQTLLQKILYSVVLYASDLDPKADWVKDYPTIHQARSFVLTLQQLGWDFSVGGSAPGGMGASVGVGKVSSVGAPAAGPVLTPAFFDRAVQEILSLTDPPMKGVVFHINNMDTLLGVDPAATIRLFNDLRDYFQVADSHWVFLGPPGLRSDAVAPEKRVRDFVKSWIQLDSLPVRDVLSLVKKRYDHYRVRDKYIEPTTSDLIEYLYRPFGGDLRGTLNALSLAHKQYQPIDPAPLAKDAALEYLASHYKTHLESALRGKTIEILGHLLSLKKSEFVQDDASAVEKHQSNRSARFIEMENEEAIRLVRNEGVRKVYAFGGPTRIAYALS